MNATQYHCTKCGGYCPSGALENGLCSDCDLIGKRISVFWGRFGNVSCLVDHVSQNGIIYARRWNKKRSEWTAPRPVEYRGGYQLKASRE